MVVLAFGAGPAVADHRDEHREGFEHFQEGKYQDALEHWRRLAEQGSVNAQYNLGLMYATGRGVVRDDAEAFRWFRMAAERGDANAQINLGAMYADGLGVEPSLYDAYKWLLIARGGKEGEIATRAQTLIDEIERHPAGGQPPLTAAERRRVEAEARAFRPLPKR
jgi:hypothetical protein